MSALWFDCKTVTRDWIHFHVQEKKEQEILAEQHRKQVEEETFRLEREAEERDRLRRAEEHKDIQRKVAKERIDQLKRTTIGDRALSQYTDEVSILSRF